MSPARLVDLDSIDRRIIDQLRIDGRRSFAEVGRYVGLSEASTRKRYNRLKELGVVQVVAMQDSTRLGLIEAEIAIRVRNETVASVAWQLARLPEASFVSACVGAYDLFVEVRCNDNAHLGVFLSERVRRIPGITDATTINVLENVKDTFVWTGFREPLDRVKRGSAQIIRQHDFPTRQA